jgi:hypothetical protein
VFGFDRIESIPQARPELSIYHPERHVMGANPECQKCRRIRQRPRRASAPTTSIPNVTRTYME